MTVRDLNRAVARVTGECVEAIDRGAFSSLRMRPGPSPDRPPLDWDLGGRPPWLTSCRMTTGPAVWSRCRPTTRPTAKRSSPVWRPRPVLVLRRYQLRGIQLRGGRERRSRRRR